MPREPFGARLRALRQRRGLSQADLAVDGASASYISLLEGGRRKPTPAVAEALAARLGVTAAELLHGRSDGDRDKARLDLAFARLCLGQGDARRADEVLRDLLAGDALSDDPDRLMDARLAAAEAAERLGDLRRAVRLLEELKKNASADPGGRSLLQVAIALSRCYREAGDLNHAVTVAQSALDLCEALGLTELEGHARLVATLAAAHFDRGDLLRASVLLDDLLDRTRDSRREDRAAAYWNAALVASSRGESAEAALLGEKAAALLAEGGEDRAIARLKMTRAYILLGQAVPDPGRARALLQEALPDLRQHDSAGSVASAEVELARCELLLGNPDAAAEHAHDALRRLGDDTSLEIARARAALGEAQAALGDLPAAKANLAASAELLQHLGASREAAMAWRDQADLFQRLGDTSAALHAYRAALHASGLSPGRATTVAADPSSVRPLP